MSPLRCYLSSKHVERDDMMVSGDNNSPRARATASVHPTSAAYGNGQQGLPTDGDVHRDHLHVSAHSMPLYGVDAQAKLI